MLTAIRRRASDEQGSMVAGVIIVLVVTMLLLAMTSTVGGGLRALSVARSRGTAFQQADAGVSLALYRLDSTKTGGGSYQATSTGFTDAVVQSGARFDVTADRIVAGQNHSWLVRSVGTGPTGKRRAVVAKVELTPLFRYAFLTLDGFALTGSQTTPVAYDSGVCPSAATSCGLPLPVPGSLGSNSTFTFANATAEAFRTNWQSFDMYGRTSQAAADAACSEGACGTAPKVVAVPNRIELQRPDIPANVQTCPSGGNVVGGVILPGDYLCQDLQLQGAITVGPGGNGTGKVRIWVDGTFGAASATANHGKPPANFQIFQGVPADGHAVSGNICGADLWAALFLPGLAINCPGSNQPHIHGAVVANSYDGSGNQFDFHWDVASLSIGAKAGYAVTEWRECPAGRTSC